jgi:hypothetical protein
VHCSIQFDETFGQVGALTDRPKVKLIRHKSRWKRDTFADPERQPTTIQQNGMVPQLKTD